MFLKIKKDLNDWQYVSADTNSRNFYKNVWTKELQDVVYGKKLPIYEQTYTVQEHLKSPGLKKRTNMLSEIFDSKEFKDTMVKESLSWRMKEEKSLKTIKEGREYVEKALKKSDSYVSDVYNQYSNRFDSIYKKSDKYEKANTASRVVPTSNILKEKYRNKLEKEGYNAVLDDNGAFAGEARIGDIPLVVLNSSKTLKQTGQKRVNTLLYDKMVDKHPEHSVGERQWADLTRQAWGRKEGKYYPKSAPATVKEQYRQKHRF